MIFYSHTTGIHHTDEFVEWAVLRKNRKGTERIEEGTVPIPEGFFDAENTPLFPSEVLPELRKDFRGIVTVALPAAKLLMRVLELPSKDPDELKAMVELQIDQLSPFPLDQLTVSYEPLKESDDGTRVLALAAPRNEVDQLGDLFKEKSIYIRSLDAEILAWWSLLITNSKVPLSGRVIIILEDHTEFSMIIVDDGVPVCFRSLELFHDFQNESVMDEIVEEIRYTLLSLETQYGRCETCCTEFWSESTIPDALIEKLKPLCPEGIALHDLNTIPSVAEGLALRSADRHRHHAELVPREWVELQRRKKIIRISTIASIAILCLWFAVISVTGTVFAIRKAGVNRIRKRAEQIEAPAREAQAAREEMMSLERYADRAHSALECLREITETLPDSLEINSFSYRKNNAVTLRGSGERPEPIYEYFNRLSNGGLFSGLKNEKVGLQIKQGQRMESFSVTAELPAGPMEGSR
jgi:hypothetical protein